MALLGLSSSGKLGLGTVAGIFIAFALVVSFLAPRRWPDFPGERLGLFVVGTLALFVAMMAAVVVFAGEEEGAEHGAEPVESQPAATGTGGGETTPPPSAAGDPKAGEAVFASAGCGGCHTLKAAGSTGAVGPNLDESKPAPDLVVERVTNGSGVMPVFGEQLSDKQIQDVAAYVVESTKG